MSENEVCVTLSRNEMAALIGVASKDESRHNLCGVFLDPADRVAVATDGHRLLVAQAAAAAFDDSIVCEIAGETPADRDARAERLRREHDRSNDDPRGAKGRHVVIGRIAAAAWLKACGPKESIRIRWQDAVPAEVPAEVPDADERMGALRRRARALGLDLAVCIVGVDGRERARFGECARDVQFPPWAAVIPSDGGASSSAVWAAVNAIYLASAVAALGKAFCAGKDPIVCLWAVKGPDANGGSRDPLLVTMESAGEDGVLVHWRYVLMPVRIDAPRAPWATTAVDGAAAPRPANTRPAKRKRAA